MKAIKHLIASLLIMALVACDSDNNIPVNENTNSGEESAFLENFGNAIQARFIGTVVNEDNDPIAGVTITIGSAFAITDSNGVFSITGATVYEKFAYIKAQKSGFIDGSRALVPTNGINKVKIMLLDSAPTAVITSGQAETVALPGGTEVDLPAAFETEFGFVYQGDVSVTVKLLSPDDEKMSLQMPGALLAENTDGDLRILETLGMIAVLLKGENGEKLNIASGSTATIRIPVASSITNPPATIPLWFFNEEFGYWQEEGVGTLEGSSFVAEVTHFSFWNWDFQYPSVNVCITLEDANGNAVPNTALDLYSPALNATGMYGYTNGSGEACGLVPQDDTLTLIVPDYGCVGEDFTTTIGPFSSDENITITVTNTNALTTSFIATINDCEGNAMTNGYLQLVYNNEAHTYPIDGGTLNLAIDYCAVNTTYSAQVIDVVNSQSTIVFNGNFSSPTTDLSSQMSCVDLTDTDGDGVLDIDEDLNNNNDLEDDDTDGDSIPNYQDEDDDGDGINTADEDYDNDGNPMNDDTDGDTIPDYLDDLDSSGNMFDSGIYEIGCDMSSFTYDFSVYYESGNFPNYTFAYYETLADAQNETNVLIMPYTTGFSQTTAYVRVTSINTNQNLIASITLLGYEDGDQDGLFDCEEISGTDFSQSACSPYGNITDPNNADSDGDSVNDCEEATNGTNPNDPLDF
ncbi:hypothetical protein [Lacinutrix sp. Hel_I_90]|uniref:hypothetical protein n=1 Tax=Lacinutrix sp. Hel_I_90 TaxID=1249999 RepID=UPI0005C963EF|nr:hypothetical protein [Lacinutrix sp. Hel_I_90]